jgi:hypothetical protein
VGQRKDWGVLMDVFRTLITSAEEAPLARLVCSTLGGLPYEGMFEVGLSPTGDEPATHYISSGGVGENFAKLAPFSTWAWEQPDPDQPGQWVETEYSPGYPQITAERCVEAGLEVTTEAIEFMYAASDVTDEPWQTALARLGLQRIVVPEPVEVSDAEDASVAA